MQRVTCAPGGSDPDVTLTADGREIGTKSEAVSGHLTGEIASPPRHQNTTHNSTKDYAGHHYHHHHRSRWHHHHHHRDDNGRCDNDEPAPRGLAGSPPPSRRVCASSFVCATTLLPETAQTARMVQLRRRPSRRADRSPRPSCL